MNTNLTRQADGRNEISQEHRGTTKHQSAVPPVCWCGQDLEYVQYSHCPRCGTARARRFDSIRPPLAA